MRLKAYWSLFAMLPLWWAGSDSIARPSNPGKLVAIVDATVIPMDSERSLEHQTVIVRDGRISEIGPVADVTVPEDALRIDARGRYLMPGLVDMHVHLLNKGDLLIYLANGVTTVRNMAGDARHLKWRKKIVRGKLLGPAMYTTGPFTDGYPPVSSSATVVQTPEEARRVVAEQRDAGYDFVKIYSVLSKTAYEALLAEAKRAGIAVVGHIPWSVGLAGGLRGGQASAEHLHTYPDAIEADDSPTRGKFAWERVFHAIKIDESKIPSLAAAVRDAGLWTCPTIVTGNRRLAVEEARPAWNNPELRRLGEENRRKIVKGLRDAGARLLLGSDAVSGTLEVPPGSSIHEELQEFVKAGLSPYEAIRAGTRDAAEFLKAEDEFGTLTAGKRADLILVEGNPLEDVTNAARLVGVMVHGKWLWATELDKMVASLGAARQSSGKYRSAHWAEASSMKREARTSRKNSSIRASILPRRGRLN